MACEERRQAKLDKSHLGGSAYAPVGCLGKNKAGTVAQSVFQPSFDDKKPIDGPSDPIPWVAYDNYSPTYVPSGGIPLELLNDPLVLPGAASAQPTFGSRQPWSSNPSANEGGRSRRESPDSAADNRLLTIRSALATARGSTASMDFASFLQLEPESVRPLQPATRGWATPAVRQSTAATPSAPVWRSPNVFAISGSSPADVVADKGGDGIGPGALDPTSQNSVSPSTSTVQRPSESSRGSSRWRKESDLSLDIGHALAMGPGDGGEHGYGFSARQAETRAVLPSSSIRSKLGGQRIPSLPRLWKAAFEPESPSSRTPGATLGVVGPRAEEESMGKEKGARMGRGGQRTDERIGNEWLSSLEKLYEEAEAQL
jgi:type II secretory pathway pseudopilin PulG